MNLKKIRIAISFAVFILFLLGFLGDETISTPLSDTLVSFQFIPSLLQFIHSPGSLAGLCFLFLLVAGLIFGRFYCSFLCPLGILQDICIRIFRSRGKKHTYQRPYRTVSYGLLFLTIILAVLGSLALVNLLDPYTLFGRIAVHPFKTMVLWINNMIVIVAEQFDVYALAIKKQHHIPLSILTIAMGSFGLVLAFSIISGRGYCNTICPVGAFLGMISRFSLFRFVIDRENCRSCGLCEEVCKAGCIDMDKLEIDHSRCVTCFNCTDACRKNALDYKVQFPIPSRRWTPSRRNFLAVTAVAGGTVLSAALPVRLFSLESMTPGQTPVMPPGAKNLSNFVQRCTACHLCVSVCPTNVMIPAYFEYGSCGIMQPKLDYRQGHCDFDCNACGQVCPTGAIAPLLLKEKKLTRIGTVSLNKTRCIVHVKKKHCGACGEVCPTHAIFPVEKGLVLFPEINIDFCIGCGACERACPTQPKAITIRPEIVHSKAKKYVPPASSTRQVEEHSNDFPF
ncbi:4Fe-4S binding protein [Desulfospira joergensenii]|uniref:4Fe-4S binding protein n=1 Tax=Desulfospira joergensenii TaxID=53329 RepID=UPI0003B69A3F|nr:4Fe-4S binding protein [Desulfospira joergensenii]